MSFQMEVLQRGFKSHFSFGDGGRNRRLEHSVAVILQERYELTVSNTLVILGVVATSYNAFDVSRRT